MRLRDIYNDAFDEGYRDGVILGEHSKLIAHVESMLSAKFSAEQISTILGETLDAIDKIIEEITTESE